MPIAPITGRLRKRFWIDVTCAFSLGISTAYAFWHVFLYGVHLKALERQENYYIKLERERAASSS
ncbi:hypothetical protein AMATHDRAFT_141682 [Amanita thiersii Skay4041]|uniref:Cytochrome c oxidase polypeptide VIIA n=1 Tax=Amanita thiersii Skay4041 TaxID=703135 RepID=A0A2A9NVJ7_9AGAR|nr:hypothetical protein AMATHDRAFT_141682 [Amanita thiersii Skay4041]